MRRITIRAFTIRARRLSRIREPLMIERRGIPIGIYIPLRAAPPLPTRDQVTGQVALDRLGQTVAMILARTGMSEEELVAAMTTDTLGPTD
jgi:hypothetical protein